MGEQKIIDYQCLPSQQALLPKEVSEKLIPDGYLTRDGMKRLALEYKKAEQTISCALPFCHTIEGEAFGGRIKYGDQVAGPRAETFVFQSLEELLLLPDMDFSKGRLSELLSACRELANQGETVMLKISGPYTILNLLLEPAAVFNGARKHPEWMNQVMEIIERNLLEYVKEALAAGVSIFSYGDSAGGLSVLGPRLMEKTTREFTYDFLQRMKEICQGKALILLCPKTTYALMGLGLAKDEEICLPYEMTYEEACCKMGLDLEIMGEMCINGKIAREKRKKIRRLIL